VDSGRCGPVNDFEVVEVCERCGERDGMHSWFCKLKLSPPSYRLERVARGTGFLYGKPTLSEYLDRKLLAQGFPLTIHLTTCQQMYVLTDGKTRVEQRMMTLFELKQAQERTDVATGGGWMWVLDTSNEVI
jgi:hypothetical protein